MSVDYASEKYGLAARRLATGSGDLKARLHDASSELEALSLNTENLPNEWLEQHNEIMETLAGRGTDEVGLKKNIAALDDEGAENVAAQIVDLAEALAKEETRARTTRDLELGVERT